MALQPISNRPPPLLRWRRLKRRRQLRLESGTLLAVDLSREIELQAAVQQARAHDVDAIVDCLVVVRVGGAFGAVVAVGRFA